MASEWEALNKKTEGLTPEVAAPENEKIVEVPKQDIEPQEPEQKPEENNLDEQLAKQDDSRTSNWRKMREENRALERKLAEMEERLAKVDKPATKEASVEDYELADDALAEGKHYKVLKKEIRNLNEALMKERVESRLRANFPDIFKVVTTENMKALAEVEPELVATIISSPDTYSQHVAAYKNIKKYGIGTEDPNAMEKERAQKNLAKPRSASTVSPRQGESPLAEADRFARGMTPELQSQLLKEMEEAITSR
jgi:hypothetical protein